jgi:hypothetical protein
VVRPRRFHSLGVRDRVRNRTIFLSIHGNLAVWAVAGRAVVHSSVNGQDDVLHCRMTYLA